MPPRHPISCAPSGQPTTTGTPSTHPLPPSAASFSNSPSDAGSPTPSVVGEAQPSRRYQFLKKRTPAADIPPPSVPTPPVNTVGASATVNEAREEALPLPSPPHARPLSFVRMRMATPKPDELRVMSVEVPMTAAVPDNPREATDSEMAPNPVQERERVPEPPLAASDAAPSRDEPRVSTGHAVVRIPGESRGIIDPDTPSVPDLSQPSTGHEALAVPGEPQETIASKPVHVPGKSRETAAPEVSNVPGELREVVAPQKSHDPSEVQKTAAPEVSNISNEFRGTAAPQPSPVPGESQETAAPEVSNVSGKLRDIVAPQKSHDPSEVQETTALDVSNISGEFWDPAAPRPLPIPGESRENAAPEVSYASNESVDTAAPEAAHVPDKRWAPECSDDGDKMEIDSVVKDEEDAISQAKSGRFTIDYGAISSAPIRETLRCRPPGRLILDPSDHMGDLIERCTILMGAVLNLHDDISYIRDGLRKVKQSNEWKT
ncbi:hypothetical protein EDB85DRAFT_2146120 [Lactarius pseudohatsudake]|nr:hypothetical protein EDB85DRAFT_2146120 [Lactarius pseudohatsudake]